MAVHRIYIDGLAGESEGAWVREGAGALVVAGDEAKHAIRVKRLEPGDGVEVLDGLGRVASGRVAQTRKSGRGEWELVVDVGSVRVVEPARPRVEVLSAVPKGDRLGWMIDGLSQVGAASWGPLGTARGVTDPRPGKLERLERTAAEAAKQCGRAWRLAMAPGVELAEAVGPGVVMADASGEAYERAGAGVVRVLVGPEGGWTEEELATARAAGARVARFGRHVMRVEMAAVVAAAVVMDVEGRSGSVV